MGSETRIPLFRQIEHLRSRPLVCYVTSKRDGVSAQMAADALPQLIDQLHAIPSDQKGIDLLVVSNGGDPMVAWRSMCLIRERFDDVAVMVPQCAYSAATLLALGANEIIMHPNGNLGPLDPQIQINDPQHGRLRFSTEDITSFLQFVREQVGITDQEHLRVVFEQLCQHIKPVWVGYSTRAAKLSLILGERMLGFHKKSDPEIQAGRSVIESLNREFYNHGYPVGRKEARGMRLHIADDNEQLETLMWQIWVDFEDELKERTPWTPMLELMKSSEAHKLLGQAAVVADPVQFEYTTAMIESLRLCSRHKVTGSILSRRTDEMDILYNTVVCSENWTSGEKP